MNNIKIAVKVKTKKGVSDIALILLLVIALAISFVGTLISSGDVVRTQELLGFGINPDNSLGLVNLTVDEMLDVNFTTGWVDFGEGSVAPGEINCTLDTKTGNSNECMGFNDIYGGRTNFSEAARTSVTNSIYDPQMQLVGDTFFFVWVQNDTSDLTQIWTGNISYLQDEFNSEIRTSSSYSKKNPQFQVSGSKVYYVWSENDDAGLEQIWTATLNIDTNVFTATKQTTSSFDKTVPQISVLNNAVYYAWQETDATGYEQIWTANMSTDGTGWTVVNRTNSAYNKLAPQIQAYSAATEDKLYLVWNEPDASAKNQIWTMEINSTTNYAAENRTSSAFSKTEQQFQIYNNEMFFVWVEPDASVDAQLWLGRTNLDGSGWNAGQLTTDSNDKQFPQLLVDDYSMSDIYYVWEELDGFSVYQVWTGSSDTAGTGWSGLQKTTTPTNKHKPQLEHVPRDWTYYTDDLFYAWYE